MREGFGAGGKWVWILPAQPAAPAADPTSGPEKVKPATAPKFAPKKPVFAKVHFLPAEFRGRNVPWDWLDGIARLDYIEHQQLTSRFTGGASL
jgi:hypothetical protein